MYDPSKIEPKWQQYWQNNKTFKADVDSAKEKSYILDMFPYPSGSGLHAGHPEGYTATDIVSRYRRMKGRNVLHPMGWDAFGLPAENYAIKTKIHPKETIATCVERFKAQIQSIGLSYDWDREINTSSPEYYKWTQWFFLFLYENGLAYKKMAPVNWCEGCKTVLANEQVVDDHCERCDSVVIQKNLSQWFFKITNFIEDQEHEGRVTTGLLNGLKKIDWPNGTIVGQQNWVGKSKGCNVSWKVFEKEEIVLDTYTTTVDTIYGVTFVVISPEHPQLNEMVQKDQKEAVEKYLKAAKHKNEMERMAEGKEKTGQFTGAYVLHPLTNKKIPLYVADYVLMSYGTGVVMGVPAHDQRDMDFAKKYELPIIQSVKLSNGESFIYDDIDKYNVEGELIDSGEFTGMSILEAREKVVEKLISMGMGEFQIQYRLRDWSVSRQRYWGAPIPIIFCEDCGEMPVPKEDLPVMLPDDVDFMPTGVSPLIDSKTFHDVKCPKCNQPAKRESDTMDTFVCSSWYMFRFADPANDTEFASKEALKHWMPVDLYVGGAEHTVMHLLFARFFTKALHKHGYIDFDEPFFKLRHQGMILGEDGEKMSKSRGNVINPDEVIKGYGADTLRVYEMFMGPFEAVKPWSTKNIEGSFRFLQKVWRIFEEKELIDETPPEELNRLLHKTIKKVTEDIEAFKFNTAIAQMMILANAMLHKKAVHRKVMEPFILILSPFAPHLAEEIWNQLGHNESLAYEPWPEYDESLAVDDTFELIFSVNGKKRGSAQVPKSITKEEAIQLAHEDENVQRNLEGKEVVKEIYVEGKLVNVVVKN